MQILKGYYRQKIMELKIRESYIQTNIENILLAVIAYIYLSIYLFNLSLKLTEKQDISYTLPT